MTGAQRVRCRNNKNQSMKEFKNDSASAVARFGRDRRTHTADGASEHAERHPRSQREAAGSDRTPYAGKRASFNPNFTADNRPVREDRPQRNYEDRRSYGDKPAYDRPRRSFGDNDREGGERRGFGGRNNREDRPQRNYEDRRSYGDKPAYDRPRRSFGDNDREGGERRGFGGRNNREDRPQRNYEDRRSYGDKPAYDRPRRSFGDKPRGYDNRSGKFGKPGAGRPDRAGKPSGDYPRYNPARQTGEMRLNRFIAQSGICSRREADDFILAGLVSVNGTIVTELGTKVLPTDEVKFNDSRVQGEKKVYLVLNKPKGYVTSLEDPHADKTVSELVKDACTERVYPVGRLDKNSVGLLLFTNDGDLTKQLTHPSYKKKKIYQATLDKALERADMEAIAQGITLEDGEIYADEIAYVKDDKKEIGIEIHSGRNRIVRRIFEHLGYKVMKLDRVYYAGLTKKNLKRGDWRFLTREEVERLKSGQYE